MADTKITELPPRTIAAEADELPSVASGINYRAPLSSILNLSSTNRHIYDLIGLGGTPGAIDNTDAFMEFQSRVLAAEAAGTIGATLVIPPGEWNFKNDPNDTGSGAHQQWDLNIKKMKVSGYGATLYNDISLASPGIKGSGLAAPIYPYLGVYTDYTPDYEKYRIDTAESGANHIHLKTAGKTGSGIITNPGAVGGDFTVGEMVMIASGDCQFNGAPPNLQYHDYVTIIGLNVTGDLLDPDNWIAAPNTILFEPPLTNRHLETFPEYDESISGGASAVGKARVWKLNRPRVAGHEPGASFDVERVYEGFQCGSGGNGILGGKRVDLINLKGAGFSPTMYGWINIKGTKLDGGVLIPNSSPPPDFVSMSNQVAVDKLGGYINFEDCDIKKEFYANTSTCEFLRAVRTTFHTSVYLGAKFSYLQHCKMPHGMLATTYGLADVVVDQCKINSAISYAWLNYTHPAIPLANFVNGRVTIAKGVNPFAIGSAIPMIGAAVWPSLGGISGGGLIGRPWGVVTNVYDDATNFYYDIAGLPDPLPSEFISGSSTIHLNVQKLRRMMVIGSHGCWDVERLNQKTDTNIQQTKVRMTFTGAPATNISRNWVLGNLKSIRVNVVKPFTGNTTTYPAPTAPIPPDLGSITPSTAVLARFGAAGAWNPSHVNNALYFYINMHVAGVREITKTGTTGFQVGDRFVNGGGGDYLNVASLFTQGAIPYAFVSALGVTQDLTSVPSHHMPMIELSAETDVEPWDNWTRTFGMQDLAIY